MNFSSASNITLSDSLSGYVTCDEDPDNTHYLSVLSQDVSLEGMSVTLCSSDVDNDETHLVEMNSEEDVSHPFIFTIDGSNEIYGVQTARDEDGNLQKYQIQYMKTMNGELFPMLETIQLLPLEDDVHAEIAIADNIITTDNMNIEGEQTVGNDEFITENEGNNSDFEAEDQFSNHENEFNERTNTAENSIDCKSEMLSIPSSSYTNTCIKQESAELLEDNSRHQPLCDNCVSYVSEEMEMPNVKNLKVETNTPEPVEQIELNDSSIVSQEHYELDNCAQNEEQNRVLGHAEEHFEQLFVQENHVIEDCEIAVSEDVRDNDSDNETYHIVDGVHVTGDVESEDSSEQPIESVLKESVEHHPKTNILKKPTTKSFSKNLTSSDQKIIYVQAVPEKENMEVIEVGRLAKPSSRSLLKCNQPSQPPVTAPDPLQLEYVAGEGAHSNTKRYSRTKEAIQARQFLNFINSTTIPQVPERKERLPRKQQIKPVQHLDEDIIVKEMIVSSNGFIEPISVEEKKYLPVTEYVEVLDSGDECSGESDEKKKKKAKRQVEPIEIEISDSDDSDIGIFESDNQFDGSDEDKSDAITKSMKPKKKRGRPLKNKNLDNDKKDSDSNSESPPKISRTESDVESVTSSLEVIRVENEAIGFDSDNDCTNVVCSDKLPSELNINSCNVNIPSGEVNSAGNENKLVQKCSISVIPTSKAATNSHEMINTLQKSKVVPRKEFEYKYECEKCKTKFINKFLLNRHDCIVKSGLLFSCDNCHNKFPNITSLNVHKKVHAKGPSTIKSSSSTNIPQVTKTVSKGHETISAKSTTRISVSTMKYPAGNAIKNSAQVSTIPVRKPLRASASTTKYPPRPLTALKIGQNNFLKPKDPVVTTPDKTPTTNIFKIDKKCDKCSDRFDNYAAWFDHQVLQHGLKTPDKNIGERKPKKIIKSIAHNGVRAGPALTKNFLTFREKYSSSSKYD